VHVKVGSRDQYIWANICRLWLLAASWEQCTCTNNDHCHVPPTASKCDASQRNHYCL